MPKPLMPKATCVWLIDNTTLTFEQIADFCELHHLEVQGIANEEVAIGIVGVSPLETGELTSEEIKRCEKDDTKRLVMSKPELPLPVSRTKGPRYTPVSKRQDRPDAILWLLAQYPELGDTQVSRLVGTTKPTIGAIRDKTHWNMQNLKAQSPVKLGLCTQVELVTEVEKARRAAIRKEARASKAAAQTTPAKENTSPPADAPPADAGKDDAPASASMAEPTSSSEETV